MNRSFDVVMWGIIMYAVMYLAWSGLVIYGFSTGFVSVAFRFALLALVTAIAIRHVGGTPRQGVAAGLQWAAIAAALDAVFVVPFSGWALFSSWTVWAGYSFIVIVAAIVSELLARRTLPAPETSASMPRPRARVRA